MADDAERGVVDDRGRVFAGPTGSEVHDGLLVADGSIIPRPLDVNPLLTISALTERAAQALVADERLVDRGAGGRCRRVRPRPASGPAPRVVHRAHGRLDVAAVRPHPGPCRDRSTRGQLAARVRADHHVRGRRRAAGRRGHAPGARRHRQRAGAVARAAAGRRRPAPPDRAGAGAGRDVAHALRHGPGGRRRQPLPLRRHQGHPPRARVAAVAGDVDPVRDDDPRGRRHHRRRGAADPSGRLRPPGQHHAWHRSRRPARVDPRAAQLPAAVPRAAVPRVRWPGRRDGPLLVTARPRGGDAGAAAARPRGVVGGRRRAPGTRSTCLPPRPRPGCRRRASWRRARCRSVATPG